jgi:hypothetical protein
MRYVRFSIDKELRKAARGRKTKVPFGLLLHLATDGYPVAQAAIARAFSIS